MLKKLCEGYGLIEGPVWVPGRGLMFSDVLNGGVFCVTVDGEVTPVFEHRRGIGGMSIHEAGGLLVSGRNISYKPFDGGDTLLILDRDEGNGNVGYNDITTDVAGRVYAGSLGASPVFADGRQPASGDLFLIDLDGSSRKVAEDIQLTNGLGFSPDGQTLYHSDSRRQTVARYTVKGDGSLGPKEVFATTEKGAPDGLVVSTDGRVWVALAGAGGVGVFAPDGSFLELIPIPLPMCTSVCFGGDDLNELYIVSGSDGVDGDNVGAVFSMRVDAEGIAVPVARVALPG